MSLSFQQPRPVRAFRPVERLANEANIIRAFPVKVGQRPVVADCGDGFERVVESNVRRGEIDGGAAIVESQGRAKLGNGHGFPVFAGDGIPRITCQAPAGESRYERRRQNKSSHFQPPMVPVHLGTFEGERKRQRHSSHDESYGLTQALLSLLAVSSVLFAVAAFTGAL